MGRVHFLRVRVEYESAGVEYESSTSRVLRIHYPNLVRVQKFGASSPTFFTFYCIFITNREHFFWPENLKKSKKDLEIV